MKTKNLFYAFILMILLKSADSFAWDSTAAKFYPLNVGNVYIYDHIDLWFNCNPFQLIQRYKVEIDDLVLMSNGKKYFRFSGWWELFGLAPKWKYQRIDSNSMNVYSYDSLSNSEFLLDSLKIDSGNTFLCSRFNRQSPYAGCNNVGLQTVFGTQRIVKNMFAQYIGIIACYYSLVDGIGFMGYSSCEIGSGSAYSLKGCVINGIVYGDTLLTGIGQNNNIVPEKFSLSQNYPNPFNPSTIINYELQITGYVSLKVYDALGKLVATLVTEKQNAGSYNYQFSTVNYQLSSGIYFYRLEAGDFSETKRMVLIK